MVDPLILDTNSLARGVSDALRLFVGPGKRYSRELIAEATGIHLRTVKSHCLGETPPCTAALFTYFRVLPAEFAAHVLGLAGLSGVRKSEVEADAGRALAEISEGVATLALAMADGHIDHSERASVIKELREAAIAAEALAVELEKGRRQ